MDQEEEFLGCLPTDKISPSPFQFFVALSWMAKATVQAVLGAQTVAHLPANATEEEKSYANIILTLCVLSIVVTAPTGAILITLTGSKLLSKTKQPPNMEGKKGEKKRETERFFKRFPINSW